MQALRLAHHTRPHVDSQSNKMERWPNYGDCQLCIKEVGDCQLCIKEFESVAHLVFKCFKFRTLHQ
jgi:hypothetical protein